MKKFLIVIGILIIGFPSISLAERPWLLKREDIILEKKKLEIEIDVTYSNDTRKEIINKWGSVIVEVEPEKFIEVPILIATFQEIERNSLTIPLILRYGFIKDLEVMIRIPFIYKQEKVTIDSEVKNYKEQGLGDIDLHVQYKILQEKLSIPELIANLGVKFPTGKDRYDNLSKDELPLGTGHWESTLGLTACKTIDPCVIFANIRYTLTWARNEYNKRIDPGDIFEYTIGLGYAINDKLTISGEVSGALIGKDKESREKITNSDANVINLLIGATYILTPKLNLELITSFGLTDDSTDFVFKWGFPYKF
jgi:hypothetical protein